jgi:hypothetical protein
MATRAESIEGLSPRQALDIVQYMTAWLAERQASSDDLSGAQQADGLNILLMQMGYAPVPPPASWHPSEGAGGLAARQLLRLLAESEDDEQLNELDHWLGNPPEAANLAVVELAVAAIIYTACTVVLQTGFDFAYKDGKVTFRANRATPKGKDFSAVLATLRGIFEQLTGTDPAP